MASIKHLMESEPTLAATTPIYAPSLVGVATFFAGPLAGCCVIALNEHALGHRKNVVAWVLAGLALTIVMLRMGMAREIQPYRMFMPIIVATILSAIARQSYPAYVALRGRRAVVTLIAIMVGSLSIAVGVLFALVMLA